MRERKRERKGGSLCESERGIERGRLHVRVRGREGYRVCVRERVCVQCDTETQSKKGRKNSPVKLLVHIFENNNN